MAIAPPNWVVQVGSATPEFNNGNPAGADEAQQTVNGTLADIEFTVESIHNGGFTKSATISYQRSLQSEAVPIRRHALVEITLGLEIVFAGVVDTQSRNHARVTLNCISQVDLLNLAPTYGATRDHSEGAQGRFFQTALSIFNEKGLPDKSEENLNGAQFGALESIPPEGSKFKWFKSEVMGYLLENVLDDNIEDSFKAHIDPVTLSDELLDALSEFAGKDADNDLIIRGGIIDEIQALFDEFNVIGDFIPVNPFPSPPAYSLDAVNKYDPTRLKVIQYYKDAKSSDEPTIKGTPFQININDDFSSPTKIILSSGRRFVNTILTFKPKTTKDYVKSENNEDKTGEMIFSFEPTGTIGSQDLIFESDEILGDAANFYTVIDLFRTGKVGTIVSINPRFLEEPIAGEEIKFADQEIYVDFKQNQVKNIDPQREVLMGGKAWVDAKGGKGTIHMELLESLNFELAEDKLELRISGLIQRGGSLNSVVNDIKNSVDFFHIPVTIEIENRLTMISKLIDSSGVPSFDSFLIEDSGVPEKSDMIKDSILWEIRDDLRPIEFLSGFDSYSDTTGITLKSDDNNDDLIAKLAENAEATLKDAIYNDGNSMTITIPIELVPLLDETFPAAIGDWVETVGGDDENAGYGLNRPLIVRSIDYTINSKTMSFS